uniref:Leucine-rich repeat-containing N-terminal plant-type domain-containing protein n=1 Tax=Fagus sylvatica TaxID=28930 RepID=A0A2N9H9V1_FAGSY
MGASFATHMLLLLWFFTATFCLSFFKAEPHVSCNEKEKQALLTLKRGLTDPGNLLSSWSSDQEDCCRWERVRCDNKTGRVTELHLSSPLDADGLWLTTKRGWVLEFSSLRYLDLSWNDFNRACISSFLGSMGNLRHLDLRWANFSGLIPHQLGNLSGLRYLDLSGNDFNRAGLRYLDLSENDFSRTGIPSFLGSMGNLRHLDLHQANFSGLIPHQLGNLSSLRYLDLGDNSRYLYADNHSLDISVSLPLQYLGLSSIDLHKEVDWLQIMSKFPSLSELHLYYCQLDSLNPSLGFINFTSLRVLVLSENHFNHEIPNWFSNLSTTLLQLDLMSSSMKGEIPESLGKLKHLEFLDLSSNSLNGPIPQSLGNLSEM